jgi:hypothetical protein
MLIEVQPSPTLFNVMKRSQVEYEAKLAEIKNAPKFRTYIIELLEYDEQLKIEPDLTWKSFKCKKYKAKYYAKKKLKENQLIN